MAKTNFADKTTLVYASTASETTMNAMMTGLQTEFELRDGDRFLNGVIYGADGTGFACTKSGTNVVIAAGVAYCGTTTGNQKRYSGAGTVAFTAGDTANTYYVYVNSASDTTPYTKSTSNPGNGSNLVLCSVAWDGASVLGTPTDLRPYGLIPAALRCQVTGTVSADVIGLFEVDRAFWIEDVIMWAANWGTSGGPTWVDVHAGASGSAPATIFTTQGNRPTSTHSGTDYGTYTSGVPEANRYLAEGSILYVEVDAISVDLADLCVTVRGRYVR